MFKQSAVLIALIVTVPAAHAEEQMPTDTTKTYSVSDLRLVVSNSTKCDSFYKNLQSLTVKPLKLQFTRDAADSNKCSTKDLSGQLSNHTHTTVKQSVEDDVARRVGVGTFELGKDKVDYVIDIASDPKNDHHLHLYPAILSGDSGRCYCTALVKPSRETVDAFKKHIQTGRFEKGADLQ